MKKLNLFFVLLLVACNTDTTSPNIDNYLFNLNIKDSTGEPLPNTEFWVRYRVEYNENQSYFDHLVGDRAATTITFDIGETSFNSLIMYNLDYHAVDTLLYDTLSSGTHQISFNCSDCDFSYKAGVKVFMYVLESTSLESGDFIFRETKYNMLLINGAIDVNQLGSAGFTDIDGNFHTESKLWFPTLYDLSEIPAFDDFGHDLENFFLTDILSDSIEIRVEVSDSIYIHNYKVIDGINDIEIVIPDLLFRNSESIVYPKNILNNNGNNITPIGYNFNLINNSVDINPIPNPGFSLSQNYPNPFN